MRPSIAMRPALGCSSPAMQRRVVVLPQPLAPSSTEICASANSSLIDRRTETSPNDFERPSTSIGIVRIRQLFHPGGLTPPRQELGLVGERLIDVERKRFQ